MVFFFCLLGHNLGAKFHTTYTMGPIIMDHRNLIIRDSQPYIKPDDSQMGLLSKMYPFSGQQSDNYNCQLVKTLREMHPYVSHKALSSLSLSRRIVSVHHL